jgi:hypothetical protein
LLFGDAHALDQLRQRRHFLRRGRLPEIVAQKVQVIVLGTLFRTEAAAEHCAQR